MTKPPRLWSEELLCTATELSPSYPIDGAPTIADLLDAHAPVALGVSGGKDSTAMVLATNAYLEKRGHHGPRVLIHSDLGRVEWKASLPMCQRLADRLGLELVVRRQAGDLMARWLVRWHNNVKRYAHLECVKLILPWSTASMRFCTSELKTAVICRDLVERFPGQTILSASGIRREESAIRAHAPICMPQARLTNKTFQTSGYDWHPVLSWTREQVLAYHQVCEFPLHEAYTRYGTSRVSCVYCILASFADLVAATTCPENHEIYREMVQMEITSTFSFKADAWLGDMAPHLLDGAMQAGLVEAKRRAKLREAAESRIPLHLLYKQGWPTLMPTRTEALLLSEVRRAVADIIGIPIQYTDPDAILDRYEELMAAKAQKQRNSPLGHSEIIQEVLVL